MTKGASGSKPKEQEYYDNAYFDSDSDEEGTREGMRHVFSLVLLYILYSNLTLVNNNIAKNFREKEPQEICYFKRRPSI